MQAEWLDMMCRRFGCLPSQILAEDSQVMQMMELVAMGDTGGSDYEGAGEVFDE